MTRINSGVNPKELTDEHLLAEHREIKRICNNFYMRKLKNKFDDIPEKFTLGKGHVLFFINKPTYTLSRYQEIRDELETRGFNVTNYSKNWFVYEDFKGVSYIPDNTDTMLVKDRIAERISDGKKEYYHYYRNKLTKEQSLKILKV